VIDRMLENSDDLPGCQNFKMFGNIDDFRCQDFGMLDIIWWVDIGWVIRYRMRYDN
jgi:hypothetical protein